MRTNVKRNVTNPSGTRLQSVGFFFFFESIRLSPEGSLRGIGRMTREVKALYESLAIFCIYAIYACPVDALPTEARIIFAPATVGSQDEAAPHANWGLLVFIYHYR